MLSNRRSTMLGPSIGTRPTSCAAPPHSNTAAPPFHAANHPDAEPHSTAPSVLTATTADLPGYRIVRVAGAVYGSVTYACGKDKDTKSMFKARHGEARALTHMAYGARDTALERMARDAVARGANAVVGLSFADSDVLGCFAQTAVYGTAVYVERLENPFANK
ncbi:hypothetical protein F5X96DRAFT_609646 [Biscogniauxia mediterranea]|nr:hypothetical protein F5X96DRAFT_609646 [Biscogniauxia mediterranea]